MEKEEEERRRRRKRKKGGILSKQDTMVDTKLKSVILSDIRIPWNVS